MAERAPLPRVSTADDMGLRCPWCSQYVEEANVSLESLIDAHQHGAIEDPQRQPDGTADVFAIVVDCPSCAKPSMLRLWGIMHPQVRLIPVRTEKDAQLAAAARG